MTKIICQWCGEEIKEIDGCIPVYAPVTVKERPDVQTKIYQELTGLVFFFCNSNCRDEYMKADRRSQKIA